VHSGSGDRFNWVHLAERIPVNKIPLSPSRQAIKIMINFYTQNNYREVVKSFIPPILKSSIKNFLIKGKSMDWSHTIDILNQKPRYIPGNVELFGKSFFYTDSASFRFILQEIFEKEIYAFDINRDDPLIIDAGANIGVSVLYFKKTFPESRIIAIEADPVVSKVLKKNISYQDLTGIEVVEKALWNEITNLSFHQEGADGGRIESGSLNTTTVETALLSNFLVGEKVDFLKIDIEGAEVKVLKESAVYLKNVDKMFVEFHSFIDQKQDLADIIKIIEQAGFRYYIDSPGMSTSKPFIKRPKYAGMDFQLNIYAYR
jgi:FkbM family methyltransferase